MSTNASYGIVGVLVVLSALAGVVLYGALPEQIATHFGVSGEANGFTPKLFALILTPLLMTVLSIVLFFIPRIDPLQKNIEQFRSQYNLLVVLIISFLAYLHGLIIVWNLGYEFNMSKVVVPSIGVLLMGVGYSIRQAKRNWFVGIRTPWTLSSDAVWEKTHILASELFIISGTIALIAIFAPQYAWVFLIFPLLGTLVVTVIYSYIIYTQESTLKKTEQSNTVRYEDEHNTEG